MRLGKLSAAGMTRQKRGKSLNASIQARRKRSERSEFQRAVRSLFENIDEDRTGFIDSHEFVSAQMAIAELAAENFDEETAAWEYGDIKAFDEDADSRVTIEEFAKHIVDMTDVVGENRADVLQHFSYVVSRVQMQSRRELAAEMRRYFRAIDQSHDGMLDQNELRQLQELVNSLLGAQDSSKPGLDIDQVDKNDDGLVSIDEFIQHFCDKIKAHGLPKKDVVRKFREVRASLERENSSA